MKPSRHQQISISTRVAINGRKDMRGNGRESVEEFKARGGKIEYCKPYGIGEYPHLKVNCQFRNANRVKYSAEAL